MGVFLVAFLLPSGLTIRFGVYTNSAGVRYGGGLYMAPSSSKYVSINLCTRLRFVLNTLNRFMHWLYTGRTNMQRTKAMHAAPDSAQCLCHAWCLVALSRCIRKTSQSCHLGEDSTL